MQLQHVHGCCTDTDHTHIVVLEVDTPIGNETCVFVCRYCVKGGREGGRREGGQVEMLAEKGLMMHTL